MVGKSATLTQEVIDMIILLDDLTKRLFSNLKKESDKLERIKVVIKRKNILIDAYMDCWLEYAALGMIPEADQVYRHKWLLEVEVSNLSKEEEALTRKVLSYVG